MKATELARERGVNIGIVKGVMQRGKIPVYRITNRTHLVSLDDWDEYIESNKTQETYGFIERGAERRKERAAAKAAGKAASSAGDGDTGAGDAA